MTAHKVRNVVQDVGKNVSLSDQKPNQAAVPIVPDETKSNPSQNYRKRTETLLIPSTIIR